MKYHNKIENCLALNFGMKENIKELGKGYVKKSWEIRVAIPFFVRCTECGLRVCWHRPEGDESKLEKGTDTLITSEEVRAEAFDGSRSAS